MKLPLYLTVFKTHNALKNCTRPRMAVYGLSPDVYKRQTGNSLISPFFHAPTP